VSLAGRTLVNGVYHSFSSLESLESSFNSVIYTYVYPDFITIFTST